MAGFNWEVILGVLSVFGGCQVNLLALEVIVSDPAGKQFGNALTFLQFAGVAALSLFLQFDVSWTTGVQRRPRRLHLGYMTALAVIFYLISVGNNVVFAYDISVPLHAVFRSSSLIVTLIIGWLALGQTFSALQVTCALMVSGGVSILTVATAQQKGGGSTGNADSDVTVWLTGVAILCATTISSAGLGVIQDGMYSEARSRLPKHETGDLWREALFYTHVIPLPLFLVTALYTGMAQAIVTVPSHLYPALVANVVSQFFCIRGVYNLVNATSAVTMTLTITLRKYFSLVVSVVYFGHTASFTWMHYVSLVAVMIGGTAYPLLPRPQKKEKMN